MNLLGPAAEAVMDDLEAQGAEVSVRANVRQADRAVGYVIVAERDGRRLEIEDWGFVDDVEAIQPESPNVDRPAARKQAVGRYRWAKFINCPLCEKRKRRKGAKKVTREDGTKVFACADCQVEEGDPVGKPEPAAGRSAPPPRTKEPQGTRQTNATLLCDNCNTMRPRAGGKRGAANKKGYVPFTCASCIDRAKAAGREGVSDAVRKFLEDGGQIEVLPGAGDVPMTSLPVGVQ